MKPGYRVWLLIALLLFVSGCRQTATPAPTSGPPAPKLPVIFDDDGSPDGTTALFYLLSHPGVAVKAISISYGEAHPAIYIQHIGRKLDSLGIHDIPLGAGQDAPLAGSAGFPEGVREASNSFWGHPIPNPEKTYPVQPADELIVSILQQSPEPVTVFVSGPATNLAQALRRDPDIRQKIAAVYIMGGAVNVPGNVHDFYPDDANQVAELNIFSDPLAAREVFDSGLALYLVPLDATNQVSITRLDTRAWAKGGATADFAAEIYNKMIQEWRVKEIPIWDLMTAAIMVRPEMCGFQALHLQVVTDAGASSGQTRVLPDQEPNIQVCLEPQVDAIRQNLKDVFANVP